MSVPLPLGAHVRANDIRQHYLHYPGNGSDLVIVPGIVSPAALWQHVAEFLQPHYSVYVLDVRGRGLSEQHAELDYGVDACAQDLRAFIDALKLDKPLVLGHSMGARIGARAGALGADISHLLMVDPPASAPGRRPYPIPMQRTQDMLEACRRGEGEAYLRQPKVTPWPELMLRQRAQWMATCDPRVIERSYQDFNGHDVYADVAKLQCDVTLLVAGASGVILEEDVTAFEAAQPRLRTVTIPGAAHQMQAENTDLFFSTLRQVLSLSS